ncbi:MAG: chromosome segregation protein SMC [Fibrobacterales bacterium]
MYLSKLKIFGFKSFPNKVEVNFPGNGITAIVGPNGCGKSNIMDSIRWVLGEQRVKQLRSKNMSDVIFSGTADKPALNFAEVSLIINNESGQLPSDYPEIQITRRAYRSGESEYLINNQECRLKDIHALFYDTGMGAASYSLMESRMIDALLSDKAEERRHLFEEASGISKYKQQRKETLRQLERTAFDLERVEESLRMVRQSVTRYENQAKKAEQWRTLTNRGKELEISMGYDKYFEYKSACQEFEKRKVAEENRMTELQAKLSTIELTLEEKKLTMADEEEALREAEQVVSNRKMEINDADHEAKRARERVTHQNESVERFLQEIESSKERLREIDGERLIKNEELAQFQEELEGKDEFIANFEEELQVINNRHSEVREHARDLNAELMKLIEVHSQVKNKYERALQEIENFETQKSSLQGELVDLTDKIEEVEGEFENVQESDSDLEERQEELQEQSTQSQNALEEVRERLDGIREQERTISSSKVSIQSELDVLKKVINSHEGVSGGVKNILNEKADIAQGILSDKIKVIGEHPDAVEFCLGDAMQFVIADTLEDSEVLLEYLEGEQKGKAVFASLDRLTQYSRTRPNLFGEGHIGWVDQQVDSDDLLTHALEAIVGNYYLVSNFQIASSLADDHREHDVWFVAVDSMRAIHTSGIVKGGKGSDDGGLLKRKSRVEELEKELIDVTYQLETVELEREELMEAVTVHATTIEESKEELDIIRGQLQNTIQTRSIAQTRLQSMREREESIQFKIEDFDEKIIPLKSALDEQSTGVDDSAGRRQELEEQHELAVEEQQEIETQKSSKEEEYKEVGTMVLQIRGAINKLQQEIEYNNKLEVNLKETVEKRQLQIEESEGFVQESLEVMQGLQNKVEELYEVLTIEESRRDDAREIFDEKRSSLDVYQKEIQTIHAQIREATEHIHKCEIKTSDLGVKASHIKERIYESYEVDLETDESITRVDYDEDEARKEITQLKEKIKKLGNINTGALEDYEEEKARLEDTEKQFKDLDTARISLEKTIQKLDTVARERFMETFNQVKNNFQDVFASLMHQGEAKLSLEEGVDPLEAKIDINARPTGKKMRGVTLLSGGERALTATALLFALYMVKPSPYCILDEVDGPLDDANIGRFVQLLRRFSRQTQFIIITHNKRTMAASDRLYGVMQEVKGISKVTSVQLEEAADIVG